MGRLRRWVETMWTLVRRRRADREMEDEMRFHMESQIEENLRRGMAAGAARAAAHHAFGGMERYREETRDARGVSWLENLARDAGYGLRLLRRTAGPSLVAGVTLALGIGATTSIYSVVKGVLLEPLPYPDAERLVGVWSRFLPESGFDFERFVLSPPEYFDYRSQSRSMADVAALQSGSATVLVSAGEPQRVRAVGATASLFPVLGVFPALGRAFTAEEDVPDGGRVVVLSDGFWRGSFGGDARVLGRSIVVNGRDVEVIGVMPAGFSFPREDVSIWMPAGLDPGATQLRQSHFLTAVARLAPGASLESAQSEMTTLMAGWRAEYPEIHTGHFLFLTRLLDDVVGGVRATLFLLLGSVAIVLLIACANVTSILLARAGSRRREIAVRAALGAGRARLVQQHLTESLLLALSGGLFGVILARVGLAVLLPAAAGTLPRTANISVDTGVLLFALAVSVVAALAAGTVPALRMASTPPQAALLEGGRWQSGGRRQHRLRSGLVVVEVALAVIVVAGAGLLVRSYRALAAVDAGFDADHVLIAHLALPSADYPDSASVIHFYEGLRDRLAALPGVRTVSATSAAPLYNGPGTTDFDVEGRPPRQSGERMTAGSLISVMPEFFTATGMQLLEGRFIAATDREGTEPVTVVSRSLAETYFPGASPLGRRIRVAGSQIQPWLTIVGVVDEVKYTTLQETPYPRWYVPFAQSPTTIAFTPRQMIMVLRAAGDETAIAPAVRSVLRELDSRLPVIRMASMQQIRDEAVAQPRFTLSLFSVFAAVALLLGAIGLYGLLSFSVNERAREVGIRRALGARSSGVLGLVVRQGMRLTAAGLLLGLAGAFALTRVMTSLLFGITPADPITWLGVALTLLTAALAATLIPAARAARLDPMRALRSE